MKLSIINERCKATCYESKSGADEYFFVLEAESGKSFTESLLQLNADMTEALLAFELTKRTTVFARFYLSDMPNQREELLASPIFAACSGGAHSVIEQPPLNAGTISILLYHIKGDTVTTEPLPKSVDGWSNGVKVAGAHYSHYWTGNVTSDSSFNSYEQTKDIFRDYTSFLAANGMTLLDNALRTWIFVRDIDNHYSGMVDARKECFHAHALTKTTRYLASTGIEARLKTVKNLVSMDALAIDGIRPEQIARMEALDHLNPTHEYGVTFERGTKITFGDREHFHISGTASIDEHGEVMHAGDAKMQTHRTLENIRALLKPHGATLDDMTHLILYMRLQDNISDVIQIIRDDIGRDIPMIAVRGAVCRPTWLIEIEGIGIKQASSDFPPFA
jgi:enamine deaminase RidA (YjgF/YER057c/UK114 family)